MQTFIGSKTVFRRLGRRLAGVLALGVAAFLLLGGACPSTGGDGPTITASFDPDRLSLRPGEAGEATLSVRADLVNALGSQDLSIGIGSDPPGFVTTAPTEVRYRLNSDTMRYPIRITAAAGAPSVTTTLWASTNGVRIATCEVTIGVGEEDPDFVLEAEPNEIITRNGVVSPDSVFFTVRSVNGYEGNLVLTRTYDGEVATVPPDDNVPIRLNRFGTVNFARKFERFAGTDPYRVTFTLTDPESGRSRSVVITVRLGPG
ncbi:MAG: hypothetical protein KIS66_09145 [Fimbriimonadaceae bacterium]|nr:hypothetical protein [Fimbriimonadaceae bacterium]